MGATKPRTSAKSSAPKVSSLPDKTFIIDNGAYTMKSGYAPELPSAGDDEKSLSACTPIPNAIAKARGNRIYIGSQLSGHVADCNEMVFRRPVEKGYIVNWEAQRETWDHSFFDERSARNKDLRIQSPEETTLILTEAPNALPVLQRNADEMVMEEWGFGGYLRCVGMSVWSFADALAFRADSDVRFSLDRSDAECLERSAIPIWRSCFANPRYSAYSHRMSTCCRLRLFTYHCDPSLQRTTAPAWDPPTRHWRQTSYELFEGDCFDEAVQYGGRVVYHE